MLTLVHNGLDLCVGSQECGVGLYVGGHFYVAFMLAVTSVTYKYVGSHRCGSCVCYVPLPP